jgi:hypothetical protein
VINAVHTWVFTAVGEVPTKVAPTVPP